MHRGACARPPKLQIAIRKSQMKSGVPDRLRSGDLLHERQACCLDYTTGTEMERVNGVAPLSRPWHGHILLLNHTRKNGVPSRTLTDNLTLRTRPLCVLSYEDENQTPGRSLSPAKSPRNEAAGATLRSGVRNGLPAVAHTLSRDIARLRTPCFGGQPSLAAAQRAKAGTRVR